MNQEILCTRCITVDFTLYLMSRLLPLKKYNSKSIWIMCAKAARRKTTNVRYERMRAHQNDMIDAMLYAFMKIVSSKWFPKHETRTYPVYFQAHPLVVKMCWVIRRWIWIAPWTELQVPDDADPIYMRDSNTLVMGKRHYALLKSTQSKDELKS